MSYNSDITAKRIWFIPRFNVWGQEGLGDLKFLIHESSPTSAVLFSSSDIGDTAQQVSFADLVDERGNSLPAIINSPRVMIRPRQSEAVFIVGDETSQTFKIARDATDSQAVTVDLLIIEMGE